ncbi:MAG TPA: GNAT family N-acetyltransferase [Terriglobia bacterium]|nr:GNAT family N-acetyltransferase [Terriglobia bacterium]
MTDRPLLKVAAQSRKGTPLGQTEVRIKGKTTFVPSVEICGRTVISTNKWLKIAAIHDEDLVEGETIADPASFIQDLKKAKLKADIFTFAQKLPDATPRYKYHLEWDNLAVIPITTFSDWWDKRVESSVRRAVRKAAKAGVEVKLAEFDDAFVQGVVNINDETPIRQGRHFWHFKKSFDAVKRENSTYAERNAFLGAYYQGELIGFIRMTYADGIANIVQILSMTKHYDKRPANALMAKAVEICSQRGISYLVYYSYVYNDTKSSLTEFKRRNGFEKVLLPRYYVPLTTRGRIALKLGFHRGLAKNIPQPLLSQLLKMRSYWNARRLKAVEGTL